MILLLLFLPPPLFFLSSDNINQFHSISGRGGTFSSSSTGISDEEDGDDFIRNILLQFSLLLFVLLEPPEKLPFLIPLNRHNSGPPRGGPDKESEQPKSNKK